MAHTVTFTLDIRHTSDGRLGEIEDQFRANFDRIASEESERGCTIEWKDLFDSPAVKFHEHCIEAVRSSAQEVVKDVPMAAEDGKMWKDMISGAGQDSCYTNQRCPTSIIFVPTKEWIRHNPREYCSPEDGALGTQVLLGAVLRYDTLRASGDSFENT